MGADDALRSAGELQDQLHAELIPVPPRTPKDLSANIRALLIDANDEGALSSPKHEIFHLLNLSVLADKHASMFLSRVVSRWTKGRKPGVFCIDLTDQGSALL